MRFQAVDFCQGTAQRAYKKTQRLQMFTKSQKSRKALGKIETTKKEVILLVRSSQKNQTKQTLPSPDTSNNLEHMQAVVPWDPGCSLFSETSLKLLQE